jgi:hypothetical protein
MPSFQLWTKDIAVGAARNDSKSIGAVLIPSVMTLPVYLVWGQPQCMVCLVHMVVLVRLRTRWVLNILGNLVRDGEECIGTRAEYSASVGTPGTSKSPSGLPKNPSHIPTWPSFSLALRSVFPQTDSPARRVDCLTSCWREDSSRNDV